MSSTLLFSSFGDDLRSHSFEFDHATEYPRELTNDSIVPSLCTHVLLDSPTNVNALQYGLQVIAICQRGLRYDYHVVLQTKGENLGLLDI